MSDVRHQEQVEQFRRRQLREHGLDSPPPNHYRRHAELPVSAAHLGQITILFGGLTVCHESLIEAGMEGLGYGVRHLPTPTKADCQVGKEYCNPGQCNPSYFTIGALINYLKRVRQEQGLTAQEIAQRYVYMTAGSCGPCRFGMYESEYRTGVANAGFEGFRILAFQQSAGLKQSREGAAIDFNLPFFLSLLNSFFLGDVLNSLASQIRPYEVVPGSTNAVMADCLDLCKKAMCEKSYDAKPGLAARLLSLVTAGYNAVDAAKFLDQLRGSWYTDVLRRCVTMLNDRVEVDYTRIKPKVKITGEFWAQTTDGDGNYRLFEFLEKENAEVSAEPVAGWIAYVLNQAIQARNKRRGLPKDMQIREVTPVRSRVGAYADYLKAMVLMRLSQWMIHREYDRLRAAACNFVPPLADQTILRELARPYINPQSAGGEGHLEVAKTIYYSTSHLAHMVLSVKPFGCMPSTQSDGVQAAVIAHYPEVIFLPIETSPDGDVNAYSRVQMALGEAKIRCKAEFAQALAQTGMSVETIRGFVAQNRELRRPFQEMSPQKGLTSRAAMFITHVAGIMGQQRVEIEPPPDREPSLVGG